MRAAAEPPLVRASLPIVTAVCASLAWPVAMSAQEAYRAYVASESEDEVAVLTFTPGEGLEVEKRIPVGAWPAEIEGPHGVFFDPSGESWYLTLGHGIPTGLLLKFDAAADTVVGVAELGMFPATVSLTPEGVLAFVVNSNFYGDHVPSTVSVVDTYDMMEIDRVETCTMPHGSRMSPDGAHNYTACMMDDQMVEMSSASLAVTRRLDLVTGAAVEGGHAGHGDGAMSGGGAVCSPTWTEPTADGAALFVACNKGNEIVEVDLDNWAITRRMPAEGAPYNLALTPDGTRLLATLKGSANLGVWDLDTGKRVALVPSLQKVTHGVVVTPDSRYAFVTVEGIGGQPGIVEVVDLQTYERVGSAEIGKQAGGIALAPTGS
jgi:DNA-binding beta-propeller fold protein YncE